MTRHKIRRLHYAPVHLPLDLNSNDQYLTDDDGATLLVDDTATLELKDD